MLLDVERNGCSASYNRLAEAAKSDWLFVIADDDLMLPGCLQAHLDASDEADVVYAPPLVWGEDDAQFRMSPPAIPAVALIRTELWRDLGGYDLTRGEQEDRDLYERATKAGARFVRADAGPTWVYRFHGGNKSRGGLA